MSKSNLTIKDALIDDQTVIKKLSAELKKENPKATNADALSLIVNWYTKFKDEPPVSESINEELEAVKSELETTKAAYNAINVGGEALAEALEIAKTSLDEMTTINGGLIAEIAELKSIEPETIEKLIEKPLEKNQFVLQVETQVYQMARKCRKFLVADGRIKGNADDPAEFFNELFDISLTFYLKTKYDNIL